MKIIIGCDHRGVELRDEIVTNLKNDGFEVSGKIGHFIFLDC